MKNDIDARQAYIDGLHQIADFLAEHPEVPLPSMGSYASGEYEPTMQIFVQHVYEGDRDQRARLAAVARAMGGADKSTHGENFVVYRRFAGIVLAAYADRGEVCERVVVGTREVITEVPDPAALAAVPTVSVTTVVEDVEWVCTPLLKTSTTSLISVPSGADS